jgi:hypothetical protein
MLPLSLVDVYAWILEKFFCSVPYAHMCDGRGEKSWTKEKVEIDFLGRKTERMRMKKA